MIGVLGRRDACTMRLLGWFATCMRWYVSDDLYWTVVRSPALLPFDAPGWRHAADEPRKLARIVGSLRTRLIAVNAVLVVINAHTV